MGLTIHVNLRIHMKCNFPGKTKKILLPAKFTSSMQGLVVQIIVSLMSLLVVKMLTVLENTISNSTDIFAEKNVSSCKSYSHFFIKNISVYAIFNDQSFNYTLIYVLNYWAQL